MDAFIQLMTDWGYIGMLLTAFLAGSLIPFSSELVLTGLLSLGLNPIGILIAATIGNTMGGMTCYWLGSLGKMEWIEKYFHIKEKHVSKKGTNIPSRKRRLDGILCFSAFHRWTYCCCSWINAKQPTHHYHCHDLRQSNKIHYLNRRFAICILKKYPCTRQGYLCHFFLLFFAHPSSLKSGASPFNSLSCMKNCIQSSLRPRGFV